MVALSKRSECFPLFLTAVGLENNFRSELQATSSNTVGDDVSGKGVAAVRVEQSAAELGYAVCDVSRIVNILERCSQPLMIKQVEGIRLELYGHPFGHPGVLVHAQVDGTDGLSLFRVSADSQKWRTKDLGRRRIVEDPVSSSDWGNGALARCASAADTPVGIRIDAGQGPEWIESGTCC